MRPWRAGCRCALRRSRHVPSSARAHARAHGTTMARTHIHNPYIPTTHCTRHPHTRQPHTRAIVLPWGGGYVRLCNPHALRAIGRWPPPRRRPRRFHPPLHPPHRSAHASVCVLVQAALLAACQEEFVMGDNQRPPLYACRRTCYVRKVAVEEARTHAGAPSPQPFAPALANPHTRPQPRPWQPPCLCAHIASQTQPSAHAPLPVCTAAGPYGTS
jgi:hypothetical protein